MQPEKVCRKCGTTSAWRFDQLARKICRTCRGKRRKALAKPKSIRPGPGRCQAHLAWVREHRCLAFACAGAPVQAHHVRASNGAGTGKKPDDKWTVPLCAAHHMELHQRGAGTFEAKYGLDLRGEAERLARASPFLKAAPVSPDL